MRFALTVALSALLVGCFPYRYTDRPGAVGRIVSSSDAAPVASATIRLSFSHPVHKHDPIETQTGTDGSFSVLAKTFWGLYLIPQESGHPGTCKVEVHAQGYLTEVREFRWWGAGPSVESLGDIALRPRPKTPNTSLERTRER
jgi:hypothetical protein